MVRWYLAPISALYQLASLDPVTDMAAHRPTQPLSNSGTVLLETARNGYAPITYSLTREEHAPNTAPPAPTATDTGVWPQPEPQLIQLKLSY